MDFSPSKPVKKAFTPGSGRKPEVNLYTPEVTKIALKKDKDGVAVALSTVITHKDQDSIKKDRARVKRQLSEAGDAQTPPVSVRSAIEDGKDKLTSVVTFWTISKIVKTPKVENAVTPVKG